MFIFKLIVLYVSFFNMHDTHLYSLHMHTISYDILKLYYILIYNKLWAFFVLWYIVNYYFLAYNILASVFFL